MLFRSERHPPGDPWPPRSDLSEVRKLRPRLQFPSSSSSGNGSRYGAVRLAGSAGQGPYRSSAGHAAAAAAAADIGVAGKSIVGVSEFDDRVGHLGKSP